MIAYNGFLSGLTKVHYDGHDLSMVYLGNHKVFPTSTPPTPTSFKINANYIGGTEATVSCNTSTTLTFTEITHLGEGYSAMTSAQIGDCVSIIDAYAFNGDDFRRCRNLSSVTISDNVTTIGQRAFTGNGLKEINFGSGVTSIGDDAFAGCINLTQVSIPNSVTTLGEAVFQDCSGLTSATLSDNIQIIEDNTFINCKSLINVHLPNNLTTIGDEAFYRCSGLTRIDIPNSVTTIGNTAFGGNTSLTSVTIGSGVTSIDSMAFLGCSSLVSITINATTPPTLADSFVFEGSTCPIYCPCESLTLYQQEWAEYASRLQCIPTPPYYSQYFTTVAKEDGTIRFNRQNLNNLSYSLDSGATWSDGYHWTVNVTAGDKVMWKYDKTSPVSNYGIGSFTATCKFDVEGNIMSLYNGDDFVGKETIPNNAFKCLFSGATTLESAENLILPSTTSQACYESMFERCTSLTTAPELPATTLSYYCYNNMFTHCESLTTAPILSATTLVSGCYYGMFQVCKSLNSITCLATEILSEHTTDNWTYGVAQNGTFTKAQGMTWTTGSDGIPSGWTIVTN